MNVAVIICNVQHYLISCPRDGADLIIIFNSFVPSLEAPKSSVSSTWTTASAPGGTGAPVLIRMHCPFCSTAALGYN